MEQNCTKSQEASTSPKPIDIEAFLKSLSTLKFKDLNLAIQMNEALAKDIRDAFDTQQVKTKMEQFYTLLFILSQHAIQSDQELVFEPKSVQKILIESGVFPDEAIPSQIQDIRLSKKEKSKPFYNISFSNLKTHVPLNKGEGFVLYRNGMCQRAMALIFNQKFSLKLKKNRKKHIEAFDFKGVDLYGHFGNRGMFNVSLNYVSLKAVEFYKGTANGKVTAYVSSEEFKHNDHNPLLRIITTLVPDRSVQPIDW